MHRGLQQDDPLSPFLFILVTELLSRILYKAENLEMFHGIRVAHLAPPISHLLFADDLVVFCRGDVKEVGNIFQCLELYCAWTAQVINHKKSGVFFFKSMMPRQKKEIKRLLRMKEVKG